MLVVIFRARMRELDAQYNQTAARMRELALSEFSCIEFYSLSEGDEEVALSYWPDEASIKAWREHPEHKEAQRIGQEKWYHSYSVEVANISRDYRMPS
ncbi:MAG: antibiotic biosynthesis monooxygenase family protein [Gammaproteobacteria bacterium]